MSVNSDNGIITNTNVVLSIEESLAVLYALDSELSKVYRSLDI